MHGTTLGRQMMSPIALLRVLSRSAFAIALAIPGVSAFAAQSAGGVNWMDPLSYEKPAFVRINLPTIATNYYLDLSSGSDSSSCGTSTSNACKTLRGLVDRNLSGLRGNSGDGAAAINVRGSGSGAFYIFNNTLAGTPGKEIVIRPWGTSVVTIRRGSQNQGLNDGNVHDIIIDGGDPATGNLLFQFVADNAGCGGPCYVLAVSGDNITVARSQFTATGATGNGWVDLIGLCNVDGLRCSGNKFINNEFYDCSTQANQCSAIYVGPCTASGGCGVDNTLIQNNIIRNMGGEGLEVNPRVSSNGVTIEGNAIHNVGFATCNDGGTRSCRPAVVLNINQSGSVDNVLIRNNLMWNTASGCVWEKSGSRGTAVPQIYNNTCYDYGKGTKTNNQPEGFSAQSFGSSAIVRNNIVYAPNGTNPFGVGVSFSADHNLCKSGGSCGSSAAVWSSTTVLSTTEDSANFLKIGTSSEAAASGINLYSDGITLDYASLLRVTVGAFDIGAFAADGVPSTRVPDAPVGLNVL